MNNEVIATLKDLTAGTVGGCAGIVAGQPLDTVKVRIQSQNLSNPLYKNALDCFVKTVRHEGPLALYKGMATPLLGNAPMQAVVFGAYGNMTRILDDYYPPAPKVTGVTTRPEYGKLYAAGSWAGVIQCVIATPAELIKCKLQVQVGDGTGEANKGSGRVAYKGPWDCAKQSIKKNGVMAGLFRGWWPTIWRDGPTYGLYFCTFEYFKYTLGPKDDTKAGVAVCLFAGGMAGVATWLFTYPFDVVKSVVQTLPDGTPGKEARMDVIAKKYYKLHGWRWFFQGLQPTLIRAVPTNAVTFLVYEYSLRIMGVR